MDKITNNALKLVAGYQFAVHKHNEARQTREDLVTPYWVHPFRVVERLRAVGVSDYEVLVAAVLHDVLEDTDTNFEELEKLFGTRVSQIVKDVSQGPDQSIEDYNTQLKNASKDSQTVKLADKWDNVNELGRMKYVTYGKQPPLEYVNSAEATLVACSKGNTKLKKLLREEITAAKQQFSTAQ